MNEMKTKAVVAVVCWLILGIASAASGGPFDFETKITASDATADARFGGAVAISGDTAVVGAEFDDENGIDSGSAYVFGVPADEDDEDEDEDEDSDDIGDHLVWGWQEDGQGQGMSYLMASDDLLEDDNHTTTTDPVELDRRNSRFVHRNGIRSDAEGDARTQGSSEHALLTALGQDHSIEVRLNIVKELAGKVDVSLNALLIAHLERIHAEAEETGKADLAKETELLLSSLEE